MNFKLDENLGTHGASLLAAAGHDVETFHGEGMGGATDDTLFAKCCAEGRVLITLDHDFGHVLRFPPEDGAGIVILEPGTRTTPARLLARIRDLLAALDAHELKGPSGSSSLAACASTTDGTAAIKATGVGPFKQAPRLRGGGATGQRHGPAS